MLICSVCGEGYPPWGAGHGWCVDCAQLNFVGAPPPLILPGAPVTPISARQREGMPTLVEDWDRSGLLRPTPLWPWPTSGDA